MILLKTSKETLPRVLEASKHALMACPDFRVGEVVLIAQKKDQLALGEKAVRYRMEIVSIQKDIDRESERLWGRHWNYIVFGTNLFPLKHPFNMQDVQVTQKNYLTGGTIFHVDSEDEEELFRRGYMNIEC